MSAPGTMLSPGAVAPAFELRDLHGRARRPLMPEAGERGPILIAFFKDDCPTCRYTLPIVARIHRALKGGGARVFGVAQDDRRRSEAFARECDVEFPVLPDDAGYPVSRMYGVTTVPSIFLVGEEGVVRRAVAGFSRQEIDAIAHEMAERIAAPPPRLYREGEDVLETRPG